MIDRSAPDDKRLAQAKELFEDSLEWMQDRNTERMTMARMFHNTDGRGQWDPDDLAYLEEEGRPALSFNLVRPKLDSMIGIIDDARLRQRVRPIGLEDRHRAEVLDHIWTQVRRELDLEDKESDMIEDGIVMGEADITLDVQPHSTHPSWVQIEATPALCPEVAWDSASRSSDRGDARVFFWDKWLELDEFRVEYPEFADRAKDFAERGSSDEDSFEGPDRGEGGGQHYHAHAGFTDYRGSRSRYYDTKGRRIRVVHMETIIPQKQWWAVDPETGHAEKISSKSQADMVRKLSDAGVMPPLETTWTWVDSVFWMEFIQDTILFEGLDPVPFDGFSAVPFSCWVDSTDGTAYGPMRNLVDPQMEVNKAHSASLDQMLSQQKPGYISEEDSIPDEESFEHNVQQGSSVAVVAKGAISENRIQPRSPAGVPDAAIKRLELSLQLLDRIAGISELETPSAANEPATAHQLRYKRAHQVLAQVLRHYHAMQRGVARKILEVIVRAMPDEQLESYLSNSPRFDVEDGIVYVFEENGPQAQDGQPQEPIAEVDIRDLRSLEYDIALEPDSMNSTLRLLESMGLVQLAQAGIPVDPVMMIERSVASRHDQERLAQYAKQVQQSQSQAEQASQQQLTAQITEGLRLEAGKRAIEASKVQETQRHNIATEALTARDTELDHVREILTLWERADNDEKQFVLSAIQAGERSPRPGANGTGAE